MANPVSLPLWQAGDLKNSISRRIARTVQEIAIPSRARGRVLRSRSMRGESPRQIARTGQCDQAAAAIGRAALAPGARVPTGGVIETVLHVAQ